MNTKTLFIFLSTLLLINACSGGGSSSNSDNNSEVTPPEDGSTDSLGRETEYINRLYVRRETASPFDIGNNQTTRTNIEAPIPSMCYTKHEANYNPCYICHQDKIVGEGRANRMNDGFLQNEYAFSDIAFTNHWSNLFEDRTSIVASITDDEIKTYIDSENYTQLDNLLSDNNFTGYIPDLDNLHLGAEAFDSDGFAKDGSGWVAFNYKPLPSTFWPSNGSTDDVMIRLHTSFRQNAQGEWSRTIYKFNLAIVEMALKNKSNTTVDSLDENIAGIDLNGDGVLGTVSEINLPEFYVGKASNIPTESFLYPRYTEFLHSVRYVGIDSDGKVYNTPRLKELRYMMKEKSYDDEQVPYDKVLLAKFYDDEFQEKMEGNNPPTFNSIAEKGLDNKMGWWVQGFIENSDGDLRPQNVEETYFCMGCHTNIGSTYDQTFSFVRKVDGKDGWGYINLQGMKDAPNLGETDGEILTYLKRVGGGSEFRAKNAVYKRYFENGVLNEEKVRNAEDVHALISPSREEALQMNKSYKVIVERQSFIDGRDGNDVIPENVHSEVDETTPTLPRNLRFDWDMRLEW